MRFFRYFLNKLVPTQYAHSTGKKGNKSTKRLRYVLKSNHFIYTLAETFMLIIRILAYAVFQIFC